VRVLIAGLPGVGKSTLAQAIAAQTGAAIVNKDLLRAAMFSPPFLEYSVEQDDFGACRPQPDL
jgi:adenylylsulfate kinase